MFKQSRGVTQNVIEVNWSHVRRILNQVLALAKKINYYDDDLQRFHAMNNL
jgi:hypothetical protein